MDNKTPNCIKEILLKQGVSVNELAERLGITRVTLSTQINGTANIKSYEKIAAALGVPLWQLFASEDDICEIGGNSKTEICAMIEFHGKLYKPTSIAELEKIILAWKEESE